MNWAERLAKAVKTKKFTAKDRKDAEDWRQCAVGESGRAGPIFDVDIFNAAPVDWQLDAAGRAFYTAVVRNNVPAAIRAYGRVKDRVLSLACGKLTR